MPLWFLLESLRCVQIDYLDVNKDPIYSAPDFTLNNIINYLYKENILEILNIHNILVIHKLYIMLKAEKFVFLQCVDITDVFKVHTDYQQLNSRVFFG